MRRSVDQRARTIRSPAKERKDKSFREQLPHNPAAAGAEREADGDLFSPRGPPCEQHVREIEAGDEQHHRSHANEQRPEGRHLCSRVRPSAGGKTRQRRGEECLILLFHREGLLKIRGQTAQRRFGRSRGDTGLEAADHEELAGCVRPKTSCLHVWKSFAI